MRKLILAAVIISIFSTPVYAEVYKCTSQTGTTIYQQSPCIQGSDTGKIEVKSKPSEGETGLRETEKAFLHDSYERKAKELKEQIEEKQKEAEYWTAERRHQEMKKAIILNGVLSSPK